MAAAEFSELWLNRAPPRAAYDARAETLYGTLVVSDDDVRFHAHTLTMPLAPLKDVEYGRFGSDLFNRWILVTYGPAENPTMAYIKDGGWRGWRPVLTRSNRPILQALQHRLEG